MNFEFLWLFTKVFSVTFGGMVSFGGTSKQSVKIFSAKILFFANSQKFPAIRYRKGSHLHVSCQSTYN